MAFVEHENEEDIYHIRSREGLARLQPREVRDRYRHLPEDTGNEMAHLLENAVYGGDVDFGTPHKYQIYDVLWDGDKPEPLRMDDGLDAAVTDTFEDALDETFGGWIYRKEAGEVYVVDLET